IEVRMAEVPQLHIVLRKQESQDRLALDDVVFKSLQADLVQGGMAEGVIAQLESRVQPHLQAFDSLVDLAPLVKLLLVHEPDGGNLVLLEHGKYFRRHLDGSRRIAAS